MSADVLRKDSNRKYVSQTFQSSEVFSPEQTYRCTIPYNCVKHAVPMVMTKGQRANRRKEIIPLRPPNHEPTLWPSSTNAIHPSKQAREKGSLVYSNLRLNDELIPDPMICNGYAGIMKEENKYPNYLSKPSGVEVFPRGRSEYQGDSLPHEMRPSQPLCDATSQALACSSDTRYSQTLYQEAYKEQQDDKEETRKYRYSQTAIPLTKPIQKWNYQEGEFPGKWPGWPGSDSKVLNKKKGEVVEKRGKLTVDDVDDLRLLKLKPEKSSEKIEEQQKSNEKDFCQRNDIVPIQNCYIVGVGPYNTGMFGSSNRLKSANLQRNATRSACDLPADRIPKKFEEFNTSTIGVHINPAIHSVADQFSQFNTNLKKRWKSFSTLKKDGEETPSSAEKDVEATPSSNKKEPYRHKIKRVAPMEPLNFSNIEEYGKIDIKEENKPRLWNLGFERMQEKYSYVLDTAARIEKLKQEAFEKMKEQRIADKMEIEEKEKVKEKYMITPNPANSFHTPGVQVGPTDLWNAVGSEEGKHDHIFHYPYKSVAARRYKLAHPDPVPNLHDWRPRYRKEMFRGYHSSVFR